MKENQNLKTSKLIMATKHVLNIGIGPQNLQRLRKAAVEDTNLGSHCRIKCKFQHPQLNKITYSLQK